MPELPPPPPLRFTAVSVGWLLAAAAGCGGGGLGNPPPTGGGGTGGGAGGTAGIADAGRAGTAGTRDAAGAGSDAAADAEAGGPDAARDAGARDTGDGAGDAFVLVDGVRCPRPAQAPITDFSYVPGDGGTTTAVHFGDPTTFAGTEYVYPTSGGWPLTSDVTGNDWHISGTIGDYSGFGLAFDGCSRLDASAFRGISFTISGSVAQGAVVTMGVSTLNDTVASSWINSHGGDGSERPGRCMPLTGTNQYTQSDCADATAAIAISAVPTVQTILWTDFTGGKPEAHVAPSDILAIYWTFPPPVGAGTTSPVTYPIDIVIDNLAFVP